jgi:hypothetical protein
MTENTIRTEADRSNEMRIRPEKSNGKSAFSGLEKRLKLESYFEEGFPVQYLPKILFVVFLGLLYISNTHYADKTTRDIEKSQSEVEDLRADCSTQGEVNGIRREFKTTI